MPTRRAFLLAAAGGAVVPVWAPLSALAGPTRPTGVPTTTGPDHFVDHEGWIITASDREALRRGGLGPITLPNGA